ncbi:MAG: response regulator [Spirochaetia bacterium]
MTILIADDSSLIRSNLIKLIIPASQNVHIKESADVKSTIEELDSSSVDVLILDIQFPDGSGFEVLEYLRKLENKPYVIVLTNYSSLSRREKCLKMGADLFLDKTDEYEKVVSIIQRHADK